MLYLGLARTAVTDFEYSSVFLLSTIKHRFKYVLNPVGDNDVLVVYTLIYVHICIYIQYLYQLCGKNKCFIKSFKHESKQIARQSSSSDCAIYALD